MQKFPKLVREASMHVSVVEVPISIMVIIMIIVATF